MYNLKNEISRELPKGAKRRAFKDGEPLLYAFDCALLERDTGSVCIYTVVNLTSGKSEIISRRANPLTTSGVEAMVERLRKSSVAGAGRYEVERPVGEKIKTESANEILQRVFKSILPAHGFAIRKEQIDLAGHILDAICNRGVTLAEAEVGTGKTLAYLVPAIIAKRGRFNDSKNLSLYPEMQYAEMSKMPIVIATSSIALQRAIMTEYIPELSRILLESGVINKPLTAVLRKGREHYVCERNLRAHLAFENDKNRKRLLESLLLPSAQIDLAEIDIAPYIKRKVSVSGRCLDHCPHRDDCQYLKFREQAQSFLIDIQVCNHNYLLADTLHRANGQAPLIPNYQTLIVDEAHKFLQAARSMYGVEFSSAAAGDLLETVDKLTFKREGFQKLARKAAKKIYDESAKLFGKLADEASEQDESEDETDRFTANMDMDAARQLRNIRDIADRLMFLLRDEAILVKANELLDWVRKKYGVKTSDIDLKRVFAKTAGEKETPESQKEYMYTQSIALHKAICYLAEIKIRADREKTARKKKGGGRFTEQQALRNETAKVCDAIWKKSRKMLPIENGLGKGSEWIIKLLWQLETIRDNAAAFVKYDELICWLETDKEDNANRLCAIPKNLDKRLFDDQWSKNVSTILTSGTLSAAGDFSHVKRTLGLERLGSRLTETSKPSPFNHRDNSLLYISDNIPFPDNKDKDYIAAVTDEIERLIYAAHGHTAVLFTSYNMMGLVYAALQQRGIPFPLMRLDKGGVREIERFKKSGNGVLFAAGALWEGIDIPGDPLSMLIIVKLPFAVPDPIGEYEQTLYKDMNEYKARVIVPEMLIKLKQGVGRLIRTEKDTGCVAILDSRVNRFGAYRARVLNALPKCRVTASIQDIVNFFRVKKTPVYFG